MFAYKSYIKYWSIVVLVLQNTALVMLMRLSRVSEGPRYITSTAVLVNEVVKLCLCLIVIAYKKRSVREMVKEVTATALNDQMMLLKLGIPSVLYVLQNNLLYVAMNHLNAALFQVLYQTKIITTAIFSVLLLHQSLTARQWLSLFILIFGLAASQMNGDSNDENGTYFVGVFAILISSITSGFASIYFEAILKGNHHSIWLNNVYLSVYGIFFSSLACFYSDAEQISTFGFFYAYDNLTWSVVSLQSIGGLCVAFVVKFADNILKGFATSVSIIMCSLISIVFLGFVPGTNFIIGTLLISAAIVIYAKEGIVRRKLSNAELKALVASLQEKPKDFCDAIYQVISEKGPFDVLLLLAEASLIDQLIELPVKTLIYFDKNSANASNHPDNYTIASAGHHMFGDLSIGFINSDATTSIQEPIDILISVNWPFNVAKEVRNDGCKSTARLARDIQPRFHFTFDDVLHYERKPFENNPQSALKVSYATRFICLAPFANIVNAKWLHELSIEPLTSCGPDLLKASLEGSTDCPYMSLKRPTEDEYASIPPRKNRMDRKNKKPRKPLPCWFCLSNPAIASHLILSIGSESYLSLAKGPLTCARRSAFEEDHLLLVPITHYSDIKSAPVAERKELMDEIDKYLSAVKEFYDSRGFDLVYFLIGRTTVDQHAHYQMTSAGVKGALTLTAEEYAIELKTEGKFNDCFMEISLPDQSKLIYEWKEQDKFDLQFARRALAGLLGCHERENWKFCERGDEEEGQDAEEFKERFKPFDFTI